jgi:ubiquitin-protein ligase
VISSASELNEISHFLANQKLLELVINIDELNPKQMEATMTRRSDIFVIYLGDDYPRRPPPLLFHSRYWQPNMSKRMRRIII